MQIQPIVVGTAGHIDHGKSTLVKVLTGIDPDRLKEEVERGMTIDLGFARFALPDGRTVGVVDVPGHERFVKNMVAGASGIDIVVLVVAADDGVMPQTREHLAIMTLLGLTRGFVALTKIDMVEPALVELATLDVRETVGGTFLEDAPIVPVSAITGAGMDEFKRTLFALCSNVKPRETSGIFRMPIQRVFSSHGFGTIVTGIPMSGSAKIGDVLEILPKHLSGKVRGLQAYQEQLTSIRAGHSSAINLADVAHDEVTRGMVVATPGFFRGVSMLGARMRALPTLDRPIQDRTEIRLHTGTAETLGELVLLDAKVLEPGAEALVQFRLADPVVVAPGDRFVVRLASPAWTLGGGVVLEESKHRLKAFKPFVLDELGRASKSLASPRELLDVVLARALGGAHSADELSVEIKRSREETERLLNDLKGQDRARKIGSPPRWIHVERLKRSEERVIGVMETWFAENAHRSLVDVRDVRRLVNLDPDFLAAVLHELEVEKRVALEPGGFVRLSSRGATLPGEGGELALAIHAQLVAAKFQPPSPLELASALAKTPKEVQQALESLVDGGRAHAIQKGEIYLAHETHEVAREAIRKNCEKNRSLDIPSLRDELQTSRKFLIPLLEHFDTAGLTIRQGANRVLKKR
ncbi:MAG: selenocysteine-specific translation elongation factor [Planctomycetota bacterium]|nr:selenocysteine-specific translation elongation factor [Planctomycetota bacterium]